MTDESAAATPRQGRPERPLTVAVAAFLLYVGAALQVAGAAAVAVSARDWDRAWQALDTSGDFDPEADVVIAGSLVWMVYALVLVVLTFRLTLARKAAAVAAGVLGGVLVCGNGCWSVLTSDYHRYSSAEQRVIDQFVPGWYQVVPDWMLAGLTAFMITIALVLLTSPSSRRFYGDPERPAPIMS
jgi:hypothetical protein